MFQFFVQRYYESSFPAWRNNCPRLKKLYLLDKWLDGKFYDPLKYSFHQETQNQTLIPMVERKPSVQHNLPRFIANTTSRKLFGGRHAPRLKHEDKNVQKKLQAFCEEMKLIPRMLEASKRGSVGAVLMTFKFLKADDHVNGLVEVHKAQYVTPTFDDFKELKMVCIHYEVSGQDLLSAGYRYDYKGNDISPIGQQYWFIREITVDGEAIYKPIPSAEWNPIAQQRNVMKLADIPNNPAMHNFGFVPGVWIQNLPDGQFPDGCSTFETALDNFIQFDYVYSQMARGLVYSATPQLVIKGELVNQSEEDNGRTVIGPTNILQLESDYKSFAGDAHTGSDAKLLEINGSGLQVAIEFEQALKRLSLEQVNMARKDLESIKGSMSGKALELIDSEYLDLIQELRTQYCDYGYLPLVKKLAVAAMRIGHPLLDGLNPKIVDGLHIEYPPNSTPDPQEFLFLVQALDIAVNGSKQGSAPRGGAGADGKPAPLPPPTEKLLDPDVARHYLLTMMDLSPDSIDRADIPGAIEQSISLPDKQVPDPSDMAPETIDLEVVGGI